MQHFNFIFSLPPFHRKQHQVNVLTDKPVGAKLRPGPGRIFSLRTRVPALHLRQQLPEPPARDHARGCRAADTGGGCNICGTLAFFAVVFLGIFGRGCNICCTPSLAPPAAVGGGAFAPTPFSPALFCNAVSATGGAFAPPWSRSIVRRSTPTAVAIARLEASGCKCRARRAMIAAMVTPRGPRAASLVKVTNERARLARAQAELAEQKLARQRGRAVGQRGR